MRIDVRLGLAESQAACPFVFIDDPCIRELLWMIVVLCIHELLWMIVV